MWVHFLSLIIKTRNTSKFASRYRFRVIGAASRCFLLLIVEGHQITVITSDGQPMSPSYVDSFMIHPGERYDFVLFANNTPGDCWIRVQSYGDCLSGNSDGHGASILHYNGFEGKEDFMPDTDVEDFTNEGIVLNPGLEQKTDRRFVPHGNMTYDPPDGHNADYTDETVGLRYYIMLWYQSTSNSYYSHPEYYQNSVRWGIRTPTLNNVVELLLIGAAGDPHQMHLHGYTFRVVGEGYDQSTSGGCSYYKDKECEDDNGNGETSGCARNLTAVVLLAFQSVL